MGNVRYVERLKVIKLSVLSSFFFFSSSSSSSSLLDSFEKRVISNRCISVLGEKPDTKVDENCWFYFINFFSLI